MKNHCLPVFVFAAIATLTGCDAPPTNAPQHTPADAVSTPATAAPKAGTASTTASIAAVLPNAAYLIEGASNGRASLKNGVYEEAIPNSNSKFIVRLGPEFALGDLDGDQVEDAAVTLLASSGGSGDFTYVAAVLNQDGIAKPAGSAFIGDRVTMKSIRIVDGTINVTWLDRADGEPMSTTPSAEVSKAFVLRNGKIEALGITAPHALRGHYTWGAEVETFQPCGSKQVFWVVGDKALLQPLRDKSADLARARGQPYQPIYVEASGMSEGKASDGFAMDYEAVYRFTAVHAVEASSPSEPGRSLVCP